MPIPSPGTYDQASQATLLAVKAKTDIIGASVALEAAGNLAAVKAKTDVIGASVALEAAGNLAAVKAKTDLLNTGYFYAQLLPRRGNAVQGTWAWIADANASIWKTDISNDTAGHWNNWPAVALNDEYAYSLLLLAGNYSFELYYTTGNNRGILSVLLGGTLLGTVDMYSAPTVYNVVTTINFAVAVDTVVLFRLKITGKNAASSSYASYMQLATLWRRS